MKKSYNGLLAVAIIAGALIVLGFGMILKFLENNDFYLLLGVIFFPGIKIGSVAFELIFIGCWETKTTAGKMISKVKINKKEIFFKKASLLNSFIISFIVKLYGLFYCCQ